MAADALPFGTLGKIILVPSIHSHINRAAHTAFPYCAFGIVGKITPVPLLLSYYVCGAHGVLPYCALFVHFKVSSIVWLRTEGRPSGVHIHTSTVRLTSLGCSPLIRMAADARPFGTLAKLF